MKLFAIYIGGEAKNSMIELHDMRFAIGRRIEDTFAELKSSWWGTPKSLHIDCWGELTSADGYNVVLKNTPSEDDLKLYFVNAGGYDHKSFTELHQNFFVVARSKSKAKVKALKQVANWKGRHEDYTYDIENCFCINRIINRKSLYIHLEQTDEPVPFEFKCGTLWVK